MRYSFIRNITDPNQHFYGWGYIVNQFTKKTKLYKDGIVLDTWVDQRNDRKQLELLTNNKWIGVLHATPSKINNYFLDRFIYSENYRLSKDTCLSLITTSEHSKKHLESLTDSPVRVLLHPKPDTGHYFDLDYYLANPSIRHSGFYARNINNFLNFKTNIDKIIYSDRENRDIIYTSALKKNESRVFYKSKYLKDLNYIDLFTKSIGYSFFDDCSASNSILEHIMSHTPLVVNRIPPVEEYLGKDYPLFLDCINDDNDKLLLDRNFIKNVSQYLKVISKRKEFTLNYFNNYLHTFDL